MNGPYVSFLQDPEPLLRGLLGQDCLGYLMHLGHVLAAARLVDKALFLKNLRMPSGLEEAHPALIDVRSDRDVTILRSHRLTHRVQLARIAPIACRRHEGGVAKVL